MPRVKFSDCKNCGHRDYRHILKQLPDHAVCANITCRCPNYEPLAKDIYEWIRQSGQMGEEAAREKIDAPCKDCGHPYTHHNALGEDGYAFRRPCGEEDCQCEDFGFTIASAFLTEQERTAEGLADSEPDEQQITDIPEELMSVTPEPSVSADDAKSQLRVKTPENGAQGLSEGGTDRTIGDIMSRHLEEELRLAGIGPITFNADEPLIIDGKTVPEKMGEQVNHPSHYQGKGPEAIEVVRWLSFNRGSAIKYIYRAGSKDPEKEAEDLEKAIWYLNDEVKLLRGEYDGK